MEASKYKQGMMILTALPACLHSHAAMQHIYTYCMTMAISSLVHRPSLHQLSWMTSYIWLHTDYETLYCMLKSET